MFDPVSRLVCSTRFEDFFAADCLKRENVFSGLPVLEKLLVDPWWKQMLEMVPEHAPTTYVSMIEDGVSTVSLSCELVILTATAN